ESDLDRSRGIGIRARQSIRAPVETRRGVRDLVAKVERIHLHVLGRGAASGGLEQVLEEVRVTDTFGRVETGIVVRGSRGSERERESSRDRRVLVEHAKDLHSE